MHRYGTSPFTLIRQPRPGDRESRFRPPQSKDAQRPRKEASHV